jgi:hypothetical protein
MKKRLVVLLVLFILLALIAVTGFSVGIKQWVSLVLAALGVSIIITSFLK